MKELKEFCYLVWKASNLTVLPETVQRHSFEYWWEKNEDKAEELILQFTFKKDY